MNEQEHTLPPFDRDATIAIYRELRLKERDRYGRWILLIKELRVTHGCSLLDAERIALSNRHRRRWVERAINAGNPSRRYALSHIRGNGPNSLIERDGESFRFRIPAP